MKVEGDSETVMMPALDDRWQQLLAYGEQQARSLGLSETDVPQLIDEYRKERRHG